jgi:hypothetical protein
MDCHQTDKISFRLLLSLVTEASVFLDYATIPTATLPELHRIYYYKSSLVVLAVACQQFRLTLDVKTVIIISSYRYFLHTDPTRNSLLYCAQK